MVKVEFTEKKHVWQKMRLNFQLAKTVEVNIDLILFLFFYFIFFFLRDFIFKNLISKRLNPLKFLQLVRTWIASSKATLSKLLKMMAM